MSVKDDGIAFLQVVKPLIAIMCIGMIFIQPARAQSTGVAGAAAAIGYAVQAVVNSADDDDGEDD